MAIKRHRVNYTFAKVGDLVRSQKVGEREAFDGEIVLLSASGAIVRDADGNEWVRAWRELEART